MTSNRLILVISILALFLPACGADYADDGESSALNLTDALEDAVDDALTQVEFSVTNTTGANFLLGEAFIAIVGDADQSLVTFTELTIGSELVTSDFDDLLHLWQDDGEISGVLAVPESLVDLIEEPEILVVSFETTDHFFLDYDYGADSLSAEDAEGEPLETGGTVVEGDIEGADDVVEGSLDQ